MAPETESIVTCPNCTLPVLLSLAHQHCACGEVYHVFCVPHASHKPDTYRAVARAGVGHP